MDDNSQSDSGKADHVNAPGQAGISRRMVSGSFAALVASLAGAGVAGSAKAATGSYRPVALGIDYATTDSPYYDPMSPPIHFPHSFMNKGTPIQSFMWLAGGEEPKGCVIFSPQRFGGDALESLITPLVNAGIHVLKFIPRGMWDEKHEYSFTSAVEDLNAAVAHLQQNDGQHLVPGAGNKRSYAIDPSRIAVLGKSGGGGMVGWISNSENPAICASISVSPPLPMEWPPSDDAAKFYAGLKEATAGRIDLAKELGKMGPKDFERFDMIKAAPKLVDKKVLLIGDNQLRYLKGAHQPLVAAMERAGAKHFSQVVMDADAYFLTVRIAMARLVLSWLKSECKF